MVIMIIIIVIIIIMKNQAGDVGAGGSADGRVQARLGFEGCTSIPSIMISNIVIMMITLIMRTMILITMMAFDKWMFHLTRSQMMRS